MDRWVALKHWFSDWAYDSKYVPAWLKLWLMPAMYLAIRDVHAEMMEEMGLAKPTMWMRGRERLFWEYSEEGMKEYRKNRVKGMRLFWEEKVKRKCK